MDPHFVSFPNMVILDVQRKSKIALWPTFPPDEGFKDREVYANFTLPCFFSDAPSHKNWPNLGANIFLEISRHIKVQDRIICLSAFGQLTFYVCIYFSLDISRVRDFNGHEHTICCVLIKNNFSVPKLNIQFFVAVGV